MFLPFLLGISNCLHEKNKMTLDISESERRHKQAKKVALIQKFSHKLENIGCNGLKYLLDNDYFKIIASYWLYFQFKIRSLNTK